jgi:thiamine pyrophosphokinase
MKRIAIVANGNPPQGFVGEIKKCDFVIGVDRAAYWLITHGIVPRVAIGDFDSVNRKEFLEIKKKVPTIKHYSAEKDFTDTELAIQYAVRQKPSEIIIYGGNGTRMDHVLGTIFLLERCIKKGIRVVFRDKTNDITLLGRGRTILQRRVGYRYVSFLAISKIIVITLKNFKYNISHTTIHRGQTLGISNEFVARQDCVRSQATTVIHRGIALAIQSRD